MTNSKLLNKLQELPEPILIVGHLLPDGDSISSCRAVSDYLNFYSRKDVDILVLNEPDAKISWVLDGAKVVNKVDKKYNSYIFLDCYPGKERCGIEVSENDNYIVVDHHLNSIEKNNGINIFAEKSPATASVLLSLGLMHPLLYVGLYTDTVYFKFYPEVHKYVAELMDQSFRCSNANEDMAFSAYIGLLTPELIREYRKKMTRLNSLESLGILSKAYVSKNITIGLFNERMRHIDIGEHRLILVESYYDKDKSHEDRNILEVLSLYADYYSVLNIETSKFSIRTSNLPAKAADVAKKFAEGNGGHNAAAGGLLNGELSHVDKDKINIFWETLLDDFKRAIKEADKQY